MYKISIYAFLLIACCACLNAPCYAQSKAQTQEDIQAAQIAMRMAEQGNPEAQYMLGIMYEDGSGVEQNLAKAFLWYEKSALQGYQDAQSTLAWMYDTGEGVPQDYYKAAQWYKKAAIQGDPESQNRLAYLYTNGLGVEQNYEQAVVWCKKSANQNYAKAQFQLATMYGLGKGVSKDLVQTYKWASVAAMNGEKNAVVLRDDTAKELTSDKLKEAKHLAKEWSPE